MTQPTPQPRPGVPASRDIVIGATVYGHDNARFGQVAGSYRSYLIVERGFFMPVDYYVPMAAIERADRDLVVLAVSRDAALTKGWERPPFTSETGQRGLRRPAVGRPSATPAAPGASAAAGRQRAAGTGTNPTGWPPAPVGTAAASTAATASATGGDPAATRPAPSDDATPDAVASPPISDVSSAAPKETTAISPAAAFADTYAVGTNTDSYQAMTDFASPESAPAPAAIAPPAGQSPESAESAVTEAAMPASDDSVEASHDGPGKAKTTPGQ